ncbi:hypothetical protein IAR50_003188 [Cryptococcus sp. DSM 104548]
MPFSFFTPPHTVRPSPSAEHSDFFFPEYPAFDFDGHLSAAGGGGLEERRESGESSCSSGSEEAEGDVEEESERETRAGQRQNKSSTPTPFPSTRPSPSRASSYPTHTPPIAQRATRPRGLTPLTPIHPHLTNSSPSSSSDLSSFHNPLRPAGAKAQPLARALFARMAEGQGLSAGGQGGKGGKKPQKMIVPSKAFKTSFTLDMSASELARR